MHVMFVQVSQRDGGKKHRACILHYAVPATMAQARTLFQFQVYRGMPQNIVMFPPSKKHFQKQKGKNNNSKQNSFTTSLSLYRLFVMTMASFFSC